MSDVNVAFTSTAYGPLWAPAVSSWLKAIAFASRHFTVQHIGKIGGSGVTDRQYTHQAENQLVADFLDHPDMTHLFMTEADMILPPDTIVKLLAMDRDMASGVYFLRQADPALRGQACLYAKPKLTERGSYGHLPVSIFPQDKPFRCEAAGLGCVLFKRHIFEGPNAVKFPWFDLSAEHYGSDMYFYTKARDAGFELWVDPTVQCDQIDYYTTTIEDYRKRLTNPDFKHTGYIIGG